jgi:tetratricopeptide (TPR) repeat protein
LRSSTSQDEGGEEADRLFEEAGRKYAEALRLKPDFHEALSNWGVALYEQAKTKAGEEADRLFEEAGRKFAEALRLKPDNPEALSNWGAALIYEATMKRGEGIRPFVGTGAAAALVGPLGYLDQPEDLALYEYDGGVDKHPPDVVVSRGPPKKSPPSWIAGEFGMPFTAAARARGFPAAIPREGGMVVAFARMNHILEIDLENERAVVEPGVVNLDVTLAAENRRLFLRARSLQPARLHHRRQRGGKRRRAAHAGLRRHHQPRARPGAGAARWHGGRDRRQGARPARLRPHRPADRLGRHHGAGHQGHGPPDAQAER